MTTVHTHMRLTRSKTISKSPEKATNKKKKARK